MLLIVNKDRKTSESSSKDDTADKNRPVFKN